MKVQAGKRLNRYFLQYPLYLLPYGNVADDYDYFLGRYCYFSDQVKAQ